MKKFIIAGVFALSACFVSCEEEEVPDYVNQNYLLGTWEVKQIGAVEPFNNGDEIISYVRYEDVENDPACNADNFVLNADGTYEVNDYENNGGCMNEGFSGEYTQADNRILLEYTNDLGEQSIVTMTVNTLTYTELIVSYTPPGATDIVFVKFAR